MPKVVGPNGDNEFAAGSTAITGWVVTGGTIDIVAGGPTVLGEANTGSQMMEVNGSSAGTIQQTFPTLVGHSYTLALFYSNNPNPAEAQPSYAAEVSVQGASVLVDQILTHAGATTANMNYLPFSATFEADSTTTTLILASRQSGFNGVYFDTVSVVPEPSSWLMLAMGAGVLLAFGWRTRRRAASREI